MKESRGWFERCLNVRTTHRDLLLNLTYDGAVPKGAQQSIALYHIQVRRGGLVLLLVLLLLLLLVLVLVLLLLTFGWLLPPLCLSLGCGGAGQGGDRGRRQGRRSSRRERGAQGR